MPARRKDVVAKWRKGLTPEQIEERLEYHREWYRTHPRTDEQKAKTKAYYLEYYRKNHQHVKDVQLEKLYDLTRTEYDKMVREQGGKCKLCGVKYKKKLRVDHDHKTGKVRGLLCSSCNLGIGLFHDDPALLRRVIAYLELHAS